MKKITTDAAVVFIEEYDSAESGIKLCQISQNNELFEIRICFPKKSYERSGEDFGVVKDVVYDYSDHSARVDDNWEHFHNGIIRILVNPASPTYSSRKMIKMLEILLNESFPSFKKLT
ncbi:hypothetical protein IJJ53_04180 [Candidatus Saccharibacteria bacterium]|nr:hypothetical protein [Candidatus Saccharibacteria bacterium]